MRAPDRPVEEVREIRPEVRRERGLLNIGAIGIGCEDALPAIDKHTENDPCPIRRPAREESEVGTGDLHIDRGEVGSIGPDCEHLSIADLSEDSRPVRRPVGLTREPKSQFAVACELTKASPIRVLQKLLVLRQPQSKPTFV